MSHDLACRTLAAKVGVYWGGGKLPYEVLFFVAEDEVVVDGPGLCVVFCY